MEYRTHSESETEAVGEALATTLSPGTVIAFTGDLGRGRQPSPADWPGDLVSASGSPAPRLPS